MPSVLFVCTANRFRSPLASTFFQRFLQDSAASGTWTVDSAGTWTSPGLPVLPEVLLIARKYGLDLRHHRSKPITESLLSNHDLILVMEAGHKEALQIEFPACSDHVYLLSQAVEQRYYDIPDSIDSLETMIEVGGNLYELIQTGFGNICNLAVRLQDIR